MSEKIINLYHIYKKEYEETGKNKELYIRYYRKLKKLGIKLHEIKETKLNERNNKNNQIYTTIIGGLGNQLFQIFHLIATAKKYNKDFYYSFDKKYINEYLKSRNTLRKKSSDYSLFSKLPEKNINTSSFTDICEKEFRYNPIQLKENINYNIHGYFQSWKYFWEYREEIKKHLYIKPVMFKKCKDILQNFKKETIALHIRIGDYKLLPDFHPIITIEYIQKSLSYYDLEKFQLLLFTDDTENALELIKPLRLNIKNVNDIFKNDEEQFILLSLTNIRICSNSSFSLMSCYFNEMYQWTKNVQYIFPSKWFGKKGPVYHMDDLMLNDKFNIDTSYKLFIMIVSCKNNTERINRIRKYYLDNLKYPYRIIIGNEDQNEKFINNGEYLSLKTSDSYYGLPKKVLMGIEYIYNNYNPDFIMKIDDDCILFNSLIDNFLEKYKNDDYIGYQVYLKSKNLHFNGGPLYLLSKKSILNIVKENKVHENCDQMEDLNIALILKKYNIYPKKNERLYLDVYYRHNCKYHFDENKENIHLGYHLQKYIPKRNLFFNISGGLGNRLFAIAYFYVLKKTFINSSFTLFDYEHKNHNLNNYEICKNIIYDIDNTFLHNTSKIKDITKTIREENAHVYDPTFLEKIIRSNSSDNILLSHYWQTPKYFKKYQDEIITLFKKSLFPKKLKDKVKMKYKKIEDSYFIHIRGGDYLKLSELYIIDIKQYLKKCFTQIQKNVHFYIITNDLNYTKNILKDFNINYTIVIDEPIESLYLMVSCKKGGIISNSTFSWWGGFFNQNRDLYMPSIWFNGKSYKDVYFENVKIINIDS